MILDIYTDGSVHEHPELGRITSWAFIAFDASKAIVHSDRGVLTGDITAMRQIGGEILGVTRGLRWCKENGFKARIFHDYNGLYFWVSDFFSDKKAWTPKNKWTRKYREEIGKNRQLVKEFIWVKGHIGNEGNELVDTLAYTAYEEYIIAKKAK